MTEILNTDQRHIAKSMIVKKSGGRFVLAALPGVPRLIFNPGFHTKSAKINTQVL